MVSHAPMASQILISHRQHSGLISHRQNSGRKLHNLKRMKNSSAPQLHQKAKKSHNLEQIDGYHVVDQTSSLSIYKNIRTQEQHSIIALQKGRARRNNNNKKRLAYWYMAHQNDGTTPYPESAVSAPDEL